MSDQADAIFANEVDRASKRWRALIRESELLKLDYEAKTRARGEMQRIEEAAHELYTRKVSECASARRNYELAVLCKPMVVADDE